MSLEGAWRRAAAAGIIAAGFNASDVATAYEDAPPQKDLPDVSIDTGVPMPGQSEEHTIEASLATRLIELGCKRCLDYPATSDLNAEMLETLNAAAASVAESAIKKNPQLANLDLEEFRRQTLLSYISQGPEAWPSILKATQQEALPSPENTAVAQRQIGPDELSTHLLTLFREQGLNEPLYYSNTEVPTPTHNGSTNLPEPVVVVTPDGHQHIYVNVSGIDEYSEPYYLSLAEYEELFLEKIQSPILEKINAGITKEEFLKTYNEDEAFRALVDDSIINGEAINKNKGIADNLNYLSVFNYTETLEAETINYDNSGNFLYFLPSGQVRIIPENAFYDILLIQQYAEDYPDLAQKFYTAHEADTSPLLEIINNLGELNPGALSSLLSYKLGLDQSLTYNSTGVPPLSFNPESGIHEPLVVYTEDGNKAVYVSVSTLIGSGADMYYADPEFMPLEDYIALWEERIASPLHQELQQYDSWGEVTAAYDTNDELRAHIEDTLTIGAAITEIRNKIEDAHYSGIFNPDEIRAGDITYSPYDYRFIIQPHGRELNVDALGFIREIHGISPDVDQILLNAQKDTFCTYPSEERPSDIECGGNDIHLQHYSPPPVPAP